MFNTYFFLPLLMIARKSTLIILLQILNGILGYIGLKFIATFMDPAEYGVVGFAYGFVSLFVIFGQLGFNSAHVKRISEGKDLKTCIGTFMATKIALAGFMAAMVILAIVFWRFVLNRGFESPYYEQVIYIMLVYFVLSILTQSMITTYRAKKEIAKSEFPLLAYNFARVGATVFIAVQGFGALALASTYVIGEVFHLLFAIYFFRGYPIGRPSYSCFKNYLHFAFPMAIATASFIIMTNIDKVFIQLFWSSYEVGQYFAVFNLSRFLIMFVAAVGMLLLPTISEMHSKKEIAKIKGVVLQSERYLSMMIFPIITIMIVYAEPFIRILLSSKYNPAIIILQILPIFVLFETLMRPYASKLSGMNKPHLARNRVLIIVVFNVFLNLLLIPRDISQLNLKLFGLGAYGAAIATVISYFAGFIYIRWIAWKVTKISGNPKIILHAFAAIIMALCIYFLNYVFFIERWYHLLFFSLIALLIYLGILYVMKEFTKDDFDFYLDILNIRKMLSYIKNEIRK